MALGLIKYLEYNDGETWKPIIWYSNKTDNDFAILAGDTEGFIEQSQIYGRNFEEFTRIIENSNIENRGIPDDVSDFIRDSIQKHNSSFFGVSYYYLNELTDLINHEEKILVSDLKSGIEFHLYETIDVLNSFLGNKVTFNEEKINSIKNMYTTKVYTIEQLKAIQSIMLYLVNKICGIIPYNKVRVVYCYC